MSGNMKPANACESDFGIQIVELQGHSILVLSGDIDVNSAPHLKHSIISILDRTDHDLIIDMHNVIYMDSTGVSTLLSAMKHLSPNGGSLNLVGCSPRIERILDITHLSSFIALHENMDDAIEAISE